MNKYISSTSNELVKTVLQLQSKSRVRKKEGLFVIEGIREISLACQASLRFKLFLYCEEISSDTEIDHIEKLSIEQNTEWIKISKGVYEHLAHRKTTEGLLAIAYSENRELKDLHLRKNPLILVAEASEKPGNIGALLRTSDAANLDAVIIANPLTDLYNPNIIRSSLGCVFTNQVVMAGSDEIISYLRDKQISIISAALSENSVPYHKTNFKIPSAIVVGTESTGLSQQWLDNSDQNVIIPMEGKIDSLNVSVSAAILIFEAKRQRRTTASPLK